MNRSRFLTAALSALTLALPAAAQGVFVPPPSNGEATGVLRGSRAAIAKELPYIGYSDVDVRQLSNAEAARIDMLLHSDLSQGEKKGHIGTVLRGGGFLERTIDGLGRR